MMHMQSSSKRGAIRYWLNEGVLIKQRSESLETMTRGNASIKGEWRQVVTYTQTRQWDIFPISVSFCFSSVCHTLSYTRTHALSVRAFWSLECSLLMETDIPSLRHIQYCLGLTTPKRGHLWVRGQRLMALICPSHSFYSLFSNCSGFFCKQCCASYLKM